MFALEAKNHGNKRIGPTSFVMLLVIEWNASRVVSVCAGANNPQARARALKDKIASKDENVMLD